MLRRSWAVPLPCFWLGSILDKSCTLVLMRLPAALRHQSGAALRNDAGASSRVELILPAPKRETLTTMPDTIQEVLQAFAGGELVVVTDDEDREGEGDLIVAASLCTPEKMAFIIRHTSGIVCAPITTDDARRLRLDPMVAHNDSSHTTAFTVSIDYKPDGRTGISAEERSGCCRALANPNVGASDFARPGHVFPLIARAGGVLLRSGHTKAPVDRGNGSGLRAAAGLTEVRKTPGPA